MRRLWALSLLAYLLSAAWFARSLLGAPPTNNESARSSHDNDVDNEPVLSDPPYDRLVLVLIDALRFDMIHAREEMAFVRSAIRSGTAKSYLARAHAPTVTLPRLKALMTGTVPRFSDLIFNLLDTESDDKGRASEDLVGRMRDAGKRIVLYGDDTWFKLFPGKFENHSDGTTSSFFTPDFVQVDHNVTRHVDEDLDPRMRHPKSTSWDAIIFHYLGLDHIGHNLGPDSPRMSLKLVEMDRVMERIFESVRLQDEKRQKRTLLLMLSDHGMNNVGNHGGSSFQETSSSLVFFTHPENQAKVESTATPLKHHGCFQVDLAPTLGFAMGVGTPKKSLGCTLQSALEGIVSNDELDKHSSWIKRRMTSDPSQASATCEELQARHLVPDAESIDVRTLAGDAAALLCVLGLIVYVLKSSPQNWTQLGKEDVFLMLIIGLHGVSLASSSGVENEHATWGYFLTLYLLQRTVQKNQPHRLYYVVSLVCLRLLRSRLEIRNFSLLTELPEAKFVNEGTSVLSVEPQGGVERFMSMLGLMALAWYSRGGFRQPTGELALWLFSWGCLAAQVASSGDQAVVFARATMLIIALASAFRKRVDFGDGLVVLTLLHRHTGLVLVNALFLFAQSRASSDESPFRRALVAMACGQLCFYGLGNSHSVATVDLAGGYVLSYGYNVIVVASLTAINVFGGPILAQLASPAERERRDDAVVWGAALVRWCAISAIALFMRGHLFIWSVFVPRWGYEALGTTLIGLILCIRNL